MVRDADFDTLKALAKGVGIPIARRSIDDIKVDLTNLCKRPGGPAKIIKASDDKALKARITITEGEELLYIRLKDHVWHWVKDGKEILKVAKNKNYTDELVTYFTSEDGEADLRKLEGLVMKHYKA